MRKSLLFFLLVSCAHTSREIPQNVPVVKGETREQHEAYANHAMIATQGKASSEIGLEILRRGGNLYDAFVAISFAMSVERPQSTGIGGGGFLIHFDAGKKKTFAYDFREVAGEHSFKKMFLDEKEEVIPNLSIDGGKSVAVPGLVAGLEYLHQRFGKMAWRELVLPAAKLAREGVIVYPHLANAIKVREKVLKSFPGSLKIFFKANGEPLTEGDKLIQNDLAKTLEKIAYHGARGFYQGSVAKDILAEVKKQGGNLSEKDFLQYQVKERTPVTGTYKGLKIVSMPPPSSGGLHVIEILNMLETDHLQMMGVLSPLSIHLTAESMQRAFADRASFLADPDFFKVPTEGLISKDYAKTLRHSFSLEKHTPSDDVFAGNPFAYESDDTIHFTLMDEEGNTLSSTQTINGLFGSGVVASGTGVVLNNQMDDFSSKPGASNLFGAIGGEANSIVPGKRPLSSMSPTIVFKENRPLLALGSPSATRILTCVTQTILNYTEYQMDLWSAVSLPRFHHQWRPDKLQIEPDVFPSWLKRELERKGHEIEEKDLGCRVQAVGLEMKEGKKILHGVSDPRGEGMAIGI